MPATSLDRITKDFINKFLTAYEMETETIHKDFERFSSYCAIKQHYSSHFETEDIENIMVGEPGDTGIDAVGIIIDNKLVNHIDDIDSFIEDKESCSIVFIFVQSTVTPKFNANKFREFTIGVKEFFYGYASPDKIKTKSRSSKVEHKATLACAILERTSEMMERPKCELYYFMGNEVESQIRVHNNVINSEKKDIQDLNLFESVNIKVTGTSSLHTLWRETLAKPKVQILFENKVCLPNIENVQESYVGTICFAEYKKLIVDEKTGNIRNVFEDNVRHFNDKYPINQKIKETIEKGNIDKFVLLNNGITIVTRKLSTSANYLTLEDYQIVNGCQTSHILYQCRNHPNINDLWITLKIIYTKDQGITNDITTATNSQTEVSFEALKSLLKFHRDLEDYYLSRSYKIDREDIKLYYARQEGKYDKDKTVPYKTRIVSIKDQVKSFAAMFMDLPHESHAFYGSRLKAKKIEDVFQQNRCFEPYYTSAVAHYELNKFIRNHRNSISEYNVARFHVLMIMKYLILGQDTPSINNKELQNACDQIMKTVQKKNKFKECILQAIDILEKAKKIPDFETDEISKLLRIKPFVDAIKTIAIQKD